MGKPKKEYKGRITEEFCNLNPKNAACEQDDEAIAGNRDTEHDDDNDVIKGIEKSLKIKPATK